ncbi:uncharacterized protein [Eurosta solidaginis]|uniref:uncharacterized protein n=1 Tax=Eurosta solidaginis TaxID=178769 RepID=UPI003530F0A8
MMESVLSLKYHINRNEIELRVDTEIDWSFVESFVDAFKPMGQYTKQLQIEQYIIGDFYRDWLICEVKLKRMTGNAFAAKLLESMEKRKEILMDNVAFLAGIYLDPRFNRRKNESEDTALGLLNDPYSILEEEFNIMNRCTLTTESNASIREKLDNSAYGQRKPFAADILDYWKNLSTKEKDLYKLAEVILAVPSSFR